MAWSFPILKNLPKLFLPFPGLIYFSNYFFEEDLPMISLSSRDLIEDPLENNESFLLLLELASLCLQMEEVLRIFRLNRFCDWPYLLLFWIVWCIWETRSLESESLYMNCCFPSLDLEPAPCLFWLNSKLFLAFVRFIYL